MLGYKHTKLAKEKMRSRFVNKINHPMFGKTHSKFTLSLISKPGRLNPMFGKTTCAVARNNKKININ